MRHKAGRPHPFRTWSRAAGQRLQARFTSHLRRGVLALVVAVGLFSGQLVPLAQLGWGITLPAAAQASAGTPNRFNSHADTTSVSHTIPSGGPTTGNPPPPGSLQHNGPPSMQPGSLALQPGKAAHFLGSDGWLEVNVPADAITAADVSQASGQLNLKITQIAPASGSNAGGSGHVSFGTYLVQVVDKNGKLAPHGLRQPVTLTFHYGPGSASDVAHAFVVFNSALPAGVSLAGAPASLPTGTPSSVLHLGPAQTKQATLDSTQQTLSVSTTLSTAATSASFNTDAPVATFGSPDPFTVDLNAGGLAFTLPIDVPTGPGGLTPPLTLTYSSDSVSEQHNMQGSASWAGEGWNLSLGVHQLGRT